MAAAGKGEGEPDYEQYDWQRVAEAKGPATTGAGAAGVGVVPDIDSLPDLPDLADDGDKVSSLGARVKEREVSLPDLPGDPDLLPPEPNPIVQGGLGFLEWTGIWILALVVIAALGGGLSYALARAKLEPEFADSALATCKLLFSVFEVLFLLRVLLTQFPKIDTTEMPWAPVHYTTEWVLAPTRMVFKPEAGVDVAPILWLVLTLLAAELLTGPSGILQMVRDSPTSMPPGMIPR